MFSTLGRRKYRREYGGITENALDVLRHAGVNVLWRDNNSGSKGVADRVRFENFRDPRKNPRCDGECRDVGMLSGLQEYIDQAREQDILIVLHQMGNHGPAYHSRYPKRFEHFTPACHSAELSECSQEEIVNAYDNAILYTDYFLSKVTELLEKNEDRFKTALFYVSDHGESLGENRVYLHGLPFSFAPQEQTHVASLMWFGKGFESCRDLARERAEVPFSHDNVSHTLLGLLEIETEAYDHDLDMLPQELWAGRRFAEVRPRRDVDVRARDPILARSGPLTSHLR